MENNFIQMAALAGHAVAYMIDRIFKHIIDYVQLYFTNVETKYCQYPPLQFLWTNIHSTAVFHKWLHEYCPLKRQ